jgi:hypothetical protein
MAFHQCAGAGESSSCLSRKMLCHRFRSDRYNLSFPDVSLSGPTNAKNDCKTLDNHQKDKDTSEFANESLDGFLSDP